MDRRTSFCGLAVRRTVGVVFVVGVDGQRDVVLLASCLKSSGRLGCGGRWTERRRFVG